MKYKSDAAKMGNPAFDEYTIPVADTDTIRRLRESASF